MSAVLSTFIVVAVLTAGEPAAETLPAAAPSAATDTAQAASTQQAAEADRISLDSSRVKRFAGALVGGAVAIAIPLAISAPTCGSPVGCTTSFQYFSLGIMPIFAGLGAYFGHHLFGGSAEFPFAALAAGAGSLLGMIALTFADSIGAGPRLLLPMIGAAAGLTVFLMAIFLDVRDHSISELPADGHATGARLWAAFGASAGVGISSAFITLLLTIVNPFAGIVSGAAMLAALPVVAWTVHHALGGQGTLSSAFWGLLVTLGTTLAVALPASITGGSLSATGSGFYFGHQTALFTGAAFLAMLLGPVAGLELSHSSAARESGLQPSLMLAPVNGGALIGGGLRF